MATSEERRQRALREREMVRDLVTNHDGWKVLYAATQKRQEGVLEKIVAGELCHDDYRTYTGELRGLRQIDEALDRLLGKAPGGPENV